MKLISLLVYTLGCYCVNSAEAHPYLIKAKLLSVTELKNGPRTTFPLAPDKSFAIDGSYRLRFVPIATLNGKPFRHEVSFDQASARPKVGGIYLVLFDLGRGAPTMLWHSYIARGFCMEDDDISKYGLKSISARLERKFPCDQTR